MPAGKPALSAVWGYSPTSVWAAGENATVWHFNGTTWKKLSTGPKSSSWFHAIADLGSNQMLAVGSENLIQRCSATGCSGTKMSSSTFNKFTWRDVYCEVGYCLLAGYHSAIPTKSAFYRVPTSGPTFTSLCTLNGPGYGTKIMGIWAAGLKEAILLGESGAAIHYNGAKCTNKGFPVAPKYLNEAWGSSITDVWAVGSTDSYTIGTIGHWNGSKWKQHSSNTNNSLLSVSGRNATDVWAVGHKGTVLHYSGSNWVPQNATSTSAVLYGVWAAKNGEVFVVGSSGTVLHYK